MLSFASWGSRRCHLQAPPWYRPDHHQSTPNMETLNVRNGQGAEQDAAALNNPVPAKGARLPFPGQDQARSCKAKCTRETPMACTVEPRS